MASWYRAGTVKLTNGSKSVIGSGTSWVKLVVAGSIFISSDFRVYEVAEVVSNTELTLALNYTGSSETAASYAAAPTQGYLPELASRISDLLEQLGDLKVAWLTGNLHGKNLVILGSKPTVDDLPTADNQSGNAWLVDGVVYTWTGDSWFDAGQLQGPKGDVGDVNPANLTAAQQASDAAVAAVVAQEAAEDAEAGTLQNALAAHDSEVSASSSAGAASGSAASALADKNTTRGYKDSVEASLASAVSAKNQAQTARDVAVNKASDASDSAASAGADSGTALLARQGADTAKALAEAAAQGAAGSAAATGADRLATESARQSSSSNALAASNSAGSAAASLVSVQQVGAAADGARLAAEAARDIAIGSKTTAAGAAASAAASQQSAADNAAIATAAKNSIVQTAAQVTTDAGLVNAAKRDTFTARDQALGVVASVNADANTASLAKDAAHLSELATADDRLAVNVAKQATVDSAAAAQDAKAAAEGTRDELILAATTASDKADIATAAALAAAGSEEASAGSAAASEEARLAAERARDEVAAVAAGVQLTDQMPTPLANPAQVGAALTSARADHVHRLPTAQELGIQASLDQAEYTANKDAPGGYAGLDSFGKLHVGQIPSVALTDTFPDVASEAEMLSLDAEKGDVAIRTDLAKTFILTAEPASGLGNWKEFLNPLSPVQSVQGRTGAVSLTKLDLGLALVDNTADIDKPVSTATQNALDGKVPDSHVGSGGTQHANVVAAGDSGFMSGADKAKLNGVAANATANATDAQLRDRATHTGAQAVSTVTGLQTALDAKAPLENPAFTGESITLNGAPVGGGASQPSATSITRTAGVVTQVTNTVSGSPEVTSITRTDGKVTQVQITHDGATRTETYTYDSAGLMTGMTAT